MITVVSAERLVFALRTDVQKIITKYGLAAHLAILAVAPLFLSETAILWVAALVAIAAVMEPSRVGSEMLHDARRRVARGFVRDPMSWVCLMLVVIASVRAVNTGVALVYDAEIAKWSLATPQVAILPGGVSGTGGWHFSAAVAGLVLVMGCRLALGRSARSAFALLSSFLAGAVAIVRVLSVRANVTALTQMSGCPGTDPVYEGCAYGLFFVLSIAALATVFERRWWRSLPMTAIGVGGTALGTFFMAPSRVIVLFAGAGLLMMLYTFVYLRIKISKTADFRSLVVCCTALAFSVMAAMTLAPDEIMQEKVSPFLTGQFLDAEFLSARKVLSRISFEVWKGHPWLGTGLGSFPIVLGMQARPEDWNVITALQTAPLNGFWLLLTERGVVGAFFLAVPLMILLVTYVYRLIGGVRSLPQPLAWVLPLVLVGAGAEMMIGCSFLAPKVLLPFLAVFSISANAFAKEKGRNV